VPLWSLAWPSRNTPVIFGRHHVPVTLEISRADLADPHLHTFLAAHLADMAPTAPPESQHALDPDGLSRQGVRVWVARLDGVLVGTGALADLPAESADERDGRDDGSGRRGSGHDGHRAPESSHAELKSMRTDPARRGEGIASQMLAHLVEDARSRGVRRISLETGSMEFFAPARRFYAAAGFVECPPFGSYVDDPHSVFMTLEL
jgi:putative acetyltransferase